MTLLDAYLFYGAQIGRYGGRSVVLLLEGLDESIELVNRNWEHLNVKFLADSSVGLNITFLYLLGSTWRHWVVEIRKLVIFGLFWFQVLVYLFLTFLAIYLFSQLLNFVFFSFLFNILHHVFNPFILEHITVFFGVFLLFQRITSWHFNFTKNQIVVRWNSMITVITHILLLSIGKVDLLPREISRSLSLLLFRHRLGPLHISLRDIWNALNCRQFTVISSALAKSCRERLLWIVWEACKKVSWRHFDLFFFLILLSIFLWHKFS